ncbi:type II secretion system protein (plasmid) [Bacillus sp. 31A1R]|uniref:Type II secretion system protein n=1 Tax=Robertmurraya mangrovi TaxID=3098077 RepID=A0ABU5IUI6_9BACI|nr:type II secretion system protein [Bacillus sp. 31A1R]MDZ5470800.1 type II secretion system protein [Bacillus sp. 31A1R]
MINSNFFRNDAGLTLLEVLLSISILGILFISILAFFNQAYSYTKVNENKTVGINVARNVLHYVEQQDFQTFKNYLETPSVDKITIRSCSEKSSNTPDNLYFSDADICNGFFSNKINNVTFTTEVILSEHPIHPEYLISALVRVKWGDHDQEAIAEGLIKNE